MSQLTAPTELDRHPLSYPQEDWCRNDAIGAFDPRFIVVTALRVAGWLDLTALRAALDDLVVRHEILRTVVVRGDVRYQQVHPPSSVPFVVHEVAADPGLSRDEQAVEIRAAAQHGTLDVAELPLLRAALHRFDSRDAVLVLTTHHSAADGWSVQLLLRDLAALYKVRAGGAAASVAPVLAPVPVPPPVPQYREFAQWQAQQLTEHSASMEFWRTTLRDATVFAPPTDRPDDRVYGSEHVAFGFELDPAICAGVQALARSARASDFTVLLGALAILAHEIGGDQDIVLNTMSAGRGEARFRDTIGLFVNFLAIRTRLAQTTTFADVIAATHKSWLGAYQHEIPIQVVEELHPQLMAPIHDRMRSDFFITYTRPVVSAGEFVFAEGARVVPTPKDKSAHVPGSTVWSLARQPSGAIVGQVEFNAEVFDTTTIERWVARYRDLLARAVSAPLLPWHDNH